MQNISKSKSFGRFVLIVMPNPSPSSKKLKCFESCQILNLIMIKNEILPKKLAYIFLNKQLDQTVQ